MSPLDRKLHRRLEALTLGVVVLSLLLPQTRELEVLTFRYLLEFDGRTKVVARDHGCVQYGVPRTEFSASYREYLRHRSGRSPDDFLMARAMTEHPDTDAPPVEDWRTHRLGSWLALASAGNLNSPYRNQVFPSREWTLAMLQASQAREPNNGLLWAAGVMLLRRSDPALARAWLAEAAARPDWDDHHREALAYLAELFEEHGLPRTDAHRSTGWAADQSALWSSVSREAAELLRAELAAPTGHPQEVAESILALGGVRWMHGRGTNPFATAILDGIRVATELQRRPDSACEGRQELEACRQWLLHDILSSRLSPELTQRLEREIARTDQGRPPLVRPGAGVPFDDTRAGWNQLAVLHIFCAGWFLAFLVLGLPRRFEAGFQENASGGPWRFWVALALSGALGAWVVFSTLQVIAPSGGFGSEPGFYEDFLSPRAFNLTVGVAFSCVVLAVQFRPGRIRLRPLSAAAVLSVPYLVSGLASVGTLDGVIKWVKAFPWAD